MAKRQIIIVDITFKDNYGELSATDLMKMLNEKHNTVKSVSIQITNKHKEK